MTDLAYMVREDWAQQGTAMVSGSARIREWLGDGPIVFAVTDKRKFNGVHSADLEAAEYIVAYRARGPMSLTLLISRVSPTMTDWSMSRSWCCIRSISGTARPSAR
jgi:hypothetical protein